MFLPNICRSEYQLTSDLIRSDQSVSHHHFLGCASPVLTRLQRSESGAKFSPWLSRLGVHMKWSRRGGHLHTKQSHHQQKSTRVTKPTPTQNLHSKSFPPSVSLIFLIPYNICNIALYNSFSNVTSVSVHVFKKIYISVH